MEVDIRFVYRVHFILDGSAVRRQRQNKQPALIARMVRLRSAHSVGICTQPIITHDLAHVSAP
jgi:hypothetical protein